MSTYMTGSGWDLNGVGAVGDVHAIYTVERTELWPEMKGKRLPTAVGAALMGIGATWSVVAVWFSAHTLISVLTEFASYWWSLFTVFFGGALCFLNQPMTLSRVASRVLCIAFSFLIVFASWRLSDQRFSRFKLSALPVESWSEMVSDLRRVGAQIGESGTNVQSSAKLPTKGLQRLGARVDYKGMFGNEIRSSEYTGVTAGILFGYKGRSWGLCVGPESFARRYSRTSNYVQVATNGFFFVAPRD